MTTFNLTNSATEVDTAIQSVVGADTLPSSGSANMVTSQGVFNHIVTELGPFKGKTLTTESTGIAATDNDTSIPTSAAVKDYVDTATTAAPQVIPPFGRLKIKILPRDFDGSKGVSTGLYTATGSAYLHWYATTDIPEGYKATHFTYTGAGIGVKVSEVTLNNSTSNPTSSTVRGETTSSGTVTITLTSAVTGSDSKYLLIEIDGQNTSNSNYYHGYVTLAAV